MVSSNVFSCFVRNGLFHLDSHFERETSCLLYTSSLSEITENGGGILGSFKDILDGVKGSLEAWQSSLKAGTLLKIAAVSYTHLDVYKRQV